MKRSREMKRSKKVLLSMGVLTVVGALAGAGTFAGFSAQTTNAGNVFAAGTLVLTDSVNAATACLSTNGSAVTLANDSTVGSPACAKSFNMTVAKPGDSFTSRLAIKNDGSIGASALTVFSSACTPANALGENYNGSGNPCDQVQIYIQQYSDPGYSLPTTCLYGGFNVLTPTICDFSSTTATLTDFASNNGSLATGVPVGTLAAGATNYFRIGVKLPVTANNTFQGRSATIDLSWNAEQVAGSASSS